MSSLEAFRAALAGAALLGFVFTSPLSAQHSGHDTANRSMPATPSAAPGLGGQAAFTTIAEVVKLLMADSTTDWSRVDLERLRQHLIDMDEVTLRAQVTQTPIPGGLRMEVRGTGRTREAIRSMVRDHAAMMQSDAALRAETAESAEGVVLTVTASDGADSRTEERIRGLGFIGWLTLQDHHAEHHVAIARGTMSAHRHEEPPLPRRW
ncbi:MAG TPA: hypothetical protein VLE53_04730 [Gemmatimonadaceae bacterium]|nr:hypothetical protein [Gemmatimonadaceae bacterium]